MSKKAKKAETSNVLEPQQTFSFTGLKGIWITNMGDDEEGEYMFYNGQEQQDPAPVSLGALQENHETSYGDKTHEARVVNIGNTQLGLRFG